MKVVKSFRAKAENNEVIVSLHEDGVITFCAGGEEKSCNFYKPDDAEKVYGMGEGFFRLMGFHIQELKHATELGG